MIQLTFPDGQIKEYEQGTSGLQVAESISKSLAKKAVAVVLNDAQLDLTRPLTESGAFYIMTRDDPEALELLRHDAAHVFAEAIKELYSDMQITIGPAIENGFYYDIAGPKTIREEDFPTIEAKMREIVDRNEAITREEWERDKAVAFFKSIGEHYKAEIIASIPADQPITLYRQGDFIDLCRGPHLPTTGKLGKAFKLMKVAGAYWRGDSNNEMLQRVYGTAWATEQQLKDYLHRLEEAEKRDHRKLGKQMGLFHLQEEAPGSIFWHPSGWEIVQTIKQYIRAKLKAHDYNEVNTPALVDYSLWEASGHAEKFGENMFTSEIDERKYALKPMNCPCHVQIFNQGIKSYRDLPYRMAEFGSCQRYEPSGALHGIMRLRAFVQDDAHIFCREDQIMEESVAFCNLLQDVYKDFGFTDIQVKFSDRPEKRAGADAVWDKAEKALTEAVNAAGLDYTLNPGEGAFYGPKLEFVLTDAIGRQWQCGTLQVDFVLPERLNANYVGEDGQKHRPVMLHRAILGSIERFIGVLIEHYGGNLPLWLAPTQVVVATVISKADAYATELMNKLKAHGIRAACDLRNEKISYKVREHSVAKVPLVLVVGENEMNQQTVTVRKLGSKNTETLAADLFMEQILQVVKEKTLVKGTE